MVTRPSASFQFSELRRRVQQDLDRRGLPRHGGARMQRKALCILAWFTCSYLGVLLLGPFHPALAIFCLLSLVLASIPLELSVMHEASHRCLSGRADVDRWWSHAITLMGPSPTLWHHQHVIGHHGSTNVPGRDPDIDSGGLLRLSTSQRWRPWHAVQHWTAAPFYSLLLVNWTWIADLRDVIVNRYRLSPSRWLALLAEVVVGRLIHALLFVVLPWWAFRDAGVVLIGYTVYWLLFGLGAALIFQLAHVNGVQAFPRDGRRGDWALHQLRTTADFAPTSQWFSWWAGGLNMQVVHHIFPGVSQVHFPGIQRIVREYCKETGTTYHVFPSVIAAVRAHFAHLRAMARPTAVSTPP